MECAKIEGLFILLCGYSYNLYAGGVRGERCLIWLGQAGLVLVFCGFF